MRKLHIILVFSVVVAFAGFSSCADGKKSAGNQEVFESSAEMVEAANAVITHVSGEELKKMYEGNGYLVLIDVRAKEEHNQGYIPGSVNIPRGVLEFRIGNEEIWDEFGLYIPQKTDTIVLYCKSANRSALAAQSLQKLGYSNVRSLDGGWIEWNKQFPELMEKIAVEEAPGASTQEHKPAASSGGC